MATTAGTPLNRRLLGADPAEIQLKDGQGLVVPGDRTGETNIVLVWDWGL